MIGAVERHRPQMSVHRAPGDGGRRADQRNNHRHRTDTAH